MKRIKPSDVADWLRVAREAARDAAPEERKQEFAQAGVASALGVREKAVWRWENGKTAPKAHQFLQLVLLYKADVGELLATKYVRGAAANASDRPTGEGKTRRMG